MNLQSVINKQLFVPHNERLLVAVEVARRRRKRLSFLPAAATAPYTTFICLSVTNTTPPQLHITKVKQFEGSASFTRRSQWRVEQLRQVNGINPNKDSPEFDLVFDNTLDQWVASSAADKCVFVQILYRACRTYGEGGAGVKLGRTGPAHRHAPAAVGTGPGEPSPGQRSRTLQTRRKSYVPPRPTEFINCQAKLTGDAGVINLAVYRCKAFLNRMKNMMVPNRKRSQGRGQLGQRVSGRSAVANVVQRMNVSLGERGDRLTRAEDKTVELMHRAQQLADNAHKLALKYAK